MQMKRILLGTSALVAAGLLVAPAHAAEKIKLGLGGFYNAAMGANFGGDDDGLDSPGDDSADSGYARNEFDIHQNIEVHIDGETTLDNGLNVHAHLELEATTMPSAGTRPGSASPAASASSASAARTKPPS
jgi:outer membrane protein OmpU